MYNLNNDKQTDSIQNRFRNIGTIPIQKEQYGHFFNKDKNKQKPDKHELSQTLRVRLEWLEYLS